MNLEHIYGYSLSACQPTELKDMQVNSGVRTKVVTLLIGVYVVLSIAPQTRF